MKSYVCMFTVFCFIQTQLVQAQQLRTVGFQAQEVVLMNSFKSSHQLFKKSLEFQKTPADLVIAIKKQMSLKDVALPEFKLTSDGAVQFHFQNQNNKLSRDQENQFRLNGKLIDLNKKEWSSGFTTSAVLGFPFLIEEAHAVEPLTVIVVAALIVVLGAVVCSAPKPTFNSTGAKWIEMGHTQAEKAIEGLIRQARKEVCSAGCGMACAASEQGAFDHLKYLNQVCAQVAGSYKNKEDFEARSQQYPAIANARAVRKTQLMTTVSIVENKSRQKLTLDVTDEQILTALVSDPDVMKWCVSRTFDRSEMPPHPSENSSGAIQK